MYTFTQADLEPTRMHWRICVKFLRRHPPRPEHFVFMADSNHLTGGQSQTQDEPLLKDQVARKGKAKKRKK